MDAFVEFNSACNLDPGFSAAFSMRGRCYMAL